MPSEEEAQEIIHKLRVDLQEVDELNTWSTDDFITSNDQVQMKRPVQHQEKQTLSPEMKKKLDTIIANMQTFSERQIWHQSIHPPTSGNPNRRTALHISTLHNPTEI